MTYTICPPYHDHNLKFDRHQFAGDARRRSLRCEFSSRFYRQKPKPIFGGPIPEIDDDDDRPIPAPVPVKTHCKKCGSKYSVRIKKRLGKVFPERYCATCARAKRLQREGGNGRNKEVSPALRSGT